MRRKKRTSAWPNKYDEHYVFWNHDKGGAVLCGNRAWDRLIANECATLLLVPITELFFIIRLACKQFSRLAVRTKYVTVRRKDQDGNDNNRKVITDETKTRKRNSKENMAHLKELGNDDPLVYFNHCSCHIGIASRAALQSYSISHYQHPSIHTHTHTPTYKYVHQITTSIYISSLPAFC